MAMPPGNVVFSDKMQFPAGGGSVATGGGVGGSAGAGGNDMHDHQRQQWFPADERDGFIMWLRGEFAAANAMIDTLCQHLRVVGEPGEYDSVLGSIQLRRCNWNPVLHMHQYFSIGEVTLALQDVALKRQQQQQQQHQQRYHYDQPKGVVKDFKRSSFNKAQKGSVSVGGGEGAKVPVHSSIENHSLDRNSSGNVSTQKFQEVKSDDGGKKLEDRDFGVVEDKKGNVKVRLPAMTFGGGIVYSRTKMEVEEAASQLLQSLRDRKGVGEICLGFDIEWKPTFRRGVLPGKAAVMQLCADYEHCHVMHIIHSGVTPSLQLLLEDSTIVKVGVGIRSDCVKVSKDYNISVKAVKDISPLANLKLGGKPRTWGLQSLTERLVCKELHKPKKIKLGNWEVSVLTKEQLEYAATDAFASWHLYEVLKSLPEPQESEKIDEPQVALQ